MDESLRPFAAPHGRSIRDKGLLILAVPLAFEIAFAIAVIAMQALAAREHQTVLGAAQTVASTHHLLQLLVDTETAIRGYIIAGEKRFLEPYDSAVERVPREIRNLERDTSSVAADLAKLKTSVSAVLTFQALQRKRIENGRRTEAARLVSAGTGKQLMDQARRNASDFLMHYGSINQLRSDRSAAARRHLRNLVLGGVLMNVIAAATMSVFFARSITRRLGVVVENTFRIERREPLLEFVGGSDEIAELDVRLHNMADALEDSRRELESFSYSVSHDLRAPLRAVSGYARIIEEDFAGNLDEDGRRYLATIRSEAARMGRLIDDLLAFSRLGRQPLQLGPVDVAAIAREALIDIPEATDPRVVVEIDAPPALADRNMLRQVFVNLLSNAIKFSAQRAEIRVEVSGSRGEHENVYRVRDYGVGFDMKYAGKLFGVFQRLHAASEFEGTGVGLAIVQRVVERHGGKVWAEAEEERGACFSFTLPPLKEEEIR